MWISRHWKDLLLLLLVVLLVGVSVSMISSSTKANKYEKLYYETYRELILAERNLELRHFEDFGTMRGWVSQWVKNKVYSVSGILTSLGNLVDHLLKGSPLWDCDDIAEQMVLDARFDGYLVSECLVDSIGSVFDTKVSSRINHDGCLAYTEGYYWYIEPQTGVIVRVARRD